MVLLAMKINEKNLANFATSKSPIDHEGWLGKKGEVYKTFQKRWFILKGNLLFYFEKKEDKEPIGVIVLEGGTVELAENDDIHAFKLVFHGEGCRTYILCASDQDSMEEWVKALATASYDYIKLMVAELQRQLDDITALEKKSNEKMKNPFRAAGLPSNHSDTCLSSRGGALSSKIQRFNPFDKWKQNATDDCNCVEPTSGMMNASSDDDIARQSAEARASSSRQKYLFIELHEYYGQIFRRLFEEHRKKKTAEDTQLISFD